MSQPNWNEWNGTLAGYWMMMEEHKARQAMSDEQRQTLQPGDRVIVRLDLGEEKEFTVKYAPWQLGHGAWVVGLKGKTGGYDLTRVVRRAE